MKRQVNDILETVVTTAIVLVLLQTVAEDILVISNSTWAVRRVFIYSGFAFDLFFTLEFLIRSWNAISNRSLRRYILFENGWVDFIVSAPLLILTSGPILLSTIRGTVFAGSGTLIGLLKVVKAVRMARILRLLRLLKIFRRIRFADSAMVQRHTVRIITTAASTLIFSAMIAGTVLAVSDLNGAEEAWLIDGEAAARGLEKTPPLELDSAKAWGLSEPSVLLLKRDEQTLYVQYNREYLREYFGPGDYSIRQAGPYSIWYDIRPTAVSQSKLNIIIFAVSLSVVLIVMLTYSPHFAITVSDPINVMLRGLREKSYNLEASIPADYSRDDIFRLAEAYNDVFLPQKERNQSGALDISIEDIGDMLK